MSKPYELVITRKEVYDTGRKEYIAESIPTLAVKRAKRMNTASAQTLFGSYYPGAGSYYKVTRINVDSTPNMDFVVHSSSAGTLDIIRGACRDFSQEVNRPLYVCKGTFKVCAYGSALPGTYVVAFSGIVD